MTRASARGFAMVLVLGAPLLASLVWLRANVGWGRPDRATVDAALHEALSFLERSGHFRNTHPRTGGTNPVEVWITRRAVDPIAFPGLARDLDNAFVVLRESGCFPFLYPLPEEPPYALSNSVRAEMAAFLGGQRLPAISIWNLWFAYALHGDLGELDEAARRRFLGYELRDWYGYNLTHRLLAYRLMRATLPAIAMRLGIPARERLAEVMVAIEASVDVFLSDLYIERVACLLDSDHEPPLFSTHWVERILEEQQPDGGWSFARSPRCGVRRLIGLSCARDQSSPHPTLLAALALVRYRERFLSDGGLRSAWGASPARDGATSPLETQNGAGPWNCRLE